VYLTVEILGGAFPMCHYHISNKQDEIRLSRPRQKKRLALDKRYSKNHASLGITTLICN